MKTNALHPSWLEVLASEFEKNYFQKIITTIKNEIQLGKIIYPKGADIFSSFNLTPFDEVKVVILGQDPYHGEGQAHGLCFSVPEGVPNPPSLQNIFIEIKRDININTDFKNGDLTAWAEQGVLLLNAALTVEKGNPMSHANIGWHSFTDRVIEQISELKNHVVFLLWGAFAQQKKMLIDSSKHCILTAPHPSPLSAYRGFMGCSHFSKTNEYLISKQKTPIQWYNS